MVQTAVQESVPSVKEEHSYWSSMSLLTVSGIMLTIGVAWRIIDQFVLGLGDTWLNIMPSKLVPFLIIAKQSLQLLQQLVDQVSLECVSAR